jgi:magnesium-transporting ATPase (P-type)
MWIMSGSVHLYVLLNVFCTLVAFIFYQELNGENVKPQYKPELEIEYKGLRVPCIMIGIVKLVLGITVVGLFQDTSLVEGSPFSLLGSSSLIFAAVNTNGSTQTRTNAILIYIGMRGLLVFIAIIHWQLILYNPYWGGGLWNISGSSQLYVLLNVFCSLVAVRFYQELKAKDANPQLKSDQDIECKCVSSNVVQKQLL